MKTQLFPLNKDGRISISIQHIINAIIVDYLLEETQVYVLLSAWDKSELFKRHLDGGELIVEDHSVHVLYPGILMADVAQARCEKFISFLKGWIDFKYHWYLERSTVKDLIKL